MKKLILILISVLTFFSCKKDSTYNKLSNHKFIVTGFLPAQRFEYLRPMHIGNTYTFTDRELTIFYDYNDSTSIGEFEMQINESFIFNKKYSNGTGSKTLYNFKFENNKMIIENHIFIDTLSYIY